MPTVSATSASPSAKLYYQDCNPSGEETVVLIHGWPLSHRMWEPQVNALTRAGYRVIAYDRRGFGDSSKPWGGYDYDTFATDLKDLLETLDLSEVSLVGFSMGGGEVARYIGHFGTDRLNRVVFAGAVTPYLLETDDNPTGVPQEVFDGLMEGVRSDRLGFLKEFLQDFFNTDELEGERISEAQVRYSHTIASLAQPYATQECITAFGTTDFREGLREVDVPTLFVHGSDDRIVPIEASARPAAELVEGSKLEVVDGAPHGFNVTHDERFSGLLMDFLDT